MTWEVGDDEWLAPPSSVPGSGPVDAVDDRIIGAVATGDRRSDVSEQHTSVEAPTKPPVAEYELSGQDLPPPPHSAAFDPNLDTPSYESGSFVAGPDVTTATGDVEGEADRSEAEPDFHIPTLSLGLAPTPSSDDVQSPDPSSPESTPSASTAEPEEPAGFVIPTLSVGSQVASPSSQHESFEEVADEEVEEVEEVEVLDDDAPIRTGDTVIARAPEPDPEPVEASALIETVYDDDEESSPLVIPGLVEPAGLEVVLEQDDTDVDCVPVEPDADTVVEPSPEGAEFIIPTLARPEPSTYEAPIDVVLPAEVDEPADIDDEVVIPSLLLASSDEDEPTGASEDPPEVVAFEQAEVDDIAEEVDEAEELHEVDAEAIESLDSADLEEVDQPVEEVEEVVEAVEAAEAKPPAPPEAKPQPKRRKAWYDDVFAEHFLFLYPLTWEETCQRDAQFINSLLGGREGMSLLDVGCGDGRHAVELAKLGAHVTGLDNSLALLLAAAQTKESSDLETGRVEFIHGDMRRLPRDREFDAVMCVGTTLGYFEEEQNWLCLQEMHDRLRPGGRLLIHVFNRDFVAPHLPSRSWWQGKRCMVIDEAEMNFFANRLRVHRTIIFDDGRQYEHYMFMRAYTVQDLGKAISQLGMRVLEVSGSRDTRGRFYGSASPDIWIVAEKK